MIWTMATRSTLCPNVMKQRGGASPAYVKDQMGHSSIQITVDTYAYLIPSTDIAWVDCLDSKKIPHQNAPEAHQSEIEPSEEPMEVTEKTWLPPRDSNPDMLIQSRFPDSENKLPLRHVPSLAW